MCADNIHRAAGTRIGGWIAKRFGNNGLPAGQIARKIAQASRVAQLDPYRAATHNKGIMNGIGRSQKTAFCPFCLGAMVSFAFAKPARCSQ